MTTDDTSRKAALARIAIHDVFVNAGRSAAEANDLVDAVVLPLVQERAEAWERGYMFAFAQERGDHTHSRPVPDYLADDIRSWNPYLTTEEAHERHPEAGGSQS